MWVRDNGSVTTVAGKLGNVVGASQASGDAGTQQPLCHSLTQALASALCQRHVRLPRTVASLPGRRRPRPRDRRYLPSHTESSGAKLSESLQLVMLIFVTKDSNIIHLDTYNTFK